MRGHPILLIFLLPALIALGHDIYLFYINHLSSGTLSLDLIKEEFKFSALGFIWTTYSPESYKEALRAVQPETWALIDYSLTFKAFFVGLGFAGILTFLFALLALFGVGPLASEERIVHGSSKDSGFRGSKKGGKMQYKRK